MKWKLLIVAVGIVIFVILFFPMQIYWLFCPHTLQDVIQQVFKSRDIDCVIAYPQQVTAQRLHRNTEYGGLDGYTKDPPVTISPEQVQQLKTLLQDPKSYDWGMGNNCVPDYAVLYSFRAEGHTVRVAFCFECNMIGVFDGQDDHAGQINNRYMFKPMRAQVIALTKTIFPNDKTIQALQ